MVRRRAGWRRLAGLMLALVLMLSAGGRTMWAAQVDPMPFEHDNARLKVRIDERWRVIPLQDGLLLVPRRPTSAIKGVELTRDGAIAVDGQIVTGADLQNRLGADADAVLRLSYLTGSERATLFQASAQPRTPTQAQTETEPIERGAGGARGKAGAGGAASAQGPGLVGLGRGPWTEVMPIARGDRFRVGGDAFVDESEQVANVTTVLGTAVINGLVSHDVVAVGGDVRLGPKAIVRGAITTIGGVLRADPSARIDGEVTELTLDRANMRVLWPHNGDHEWGDFTIGVTPDWPRIARVTFIMGLLTSGIWLALCAGALVIAPAAVTRTREHIAMSPFSALAAGLATQLFFAPVMVMLVVVLSISVIGIPLIAAVPLAMFALFLGTLFGTTAVLMALGERVVGRSMPLLALLVGAVLLCSATLVGRYLWMLSGGGLGWGLAIACVGLTAEYVAITLGLGGAVLSWTRKMTWKRNRALAPQVTPAAPAPVDL